MEQLKTARASTRAGAEYELLPWVLAQGALCQLQVLIIEWHLNRLPPHKRLSALAVRLGFHTLLHAACATPPALIEHEEPWEANTMVAVPGLYQLAARHSSPIGRVPYHIRQYLAADAQYLKVAARVDCGSRPRYEDTAGTRCKWDLQACSFEDRGHNEGRAEDARENARVRMGKRNCSVACAPYQGGLESAPFAHHHGCRRGGQVPVELLIK